MAKVSVTGFVAKMKAAKLAKKRATVARKPKTRRNVKATTKFAVHQNFDGESQFVCECKDKSMAVALAKNLNACSQTGVRFVVR